MGFRVTGIKGRGKGQWNIYCVFCIARSEVQMGTGNEFLNFNLIKK